MKIALLFITLLFSSCCLFSSRDCDCQPSKPFLVESTKDWMIPFKNEEKLFVSNDSSFSQQTVYRTYEETTQCVGGDECCTSYPVLVSNYYTKTIDGDKYLLRTTAIMDKVEFYVDNYIETFGASLNINTNQISSSANMMVLESDTVINGIQYPKLIFNKTALLNTKILFKRLVFVKGIGVVSYVDLNDRNWVLQ